MSLSFNFSKMIMSFFIFVMVLARPSAGADFGKISDAEWAIGAPADYPEANAVILFDSGSTQVMVNIIEINRHIRIKILTSAGVDEAGDLSFYYDDELDKVKGIDAHTITPDGKKHKVEKDAIFEKSFKGWKIKTLSFPQVVPGAILELKYTIRSANYWYLLPWYFHNESYCLRSIFTLKLAPEFTYNLQYLNVPYNLRKPVEGQELDPDRDFGTTKFRQIYTWTMENLPPIKEEPFMSSINDYRAGVRLQIHAFDNRYSAIVFIKNWDELGENFQTHLLDDYCAKAGDIKRLAQEVTGGLSDPYAKSKAIFNYIKDNYTVSDEYKSQYLVHDKISKVLELKYGSAEEMNILMVEMHRAVDIPAWPMLISTRENGRIDPNITDLRQFDYLIGAVQIGDTWEFLDSSSRMLPYGLLPPQCLTDAGLLVDGKQSSLVKMTIKNIESVRTDRTRLTVNGDGTVDCRSECRFTGYYASAYSELYSETKPDDFIEDNFIKKTGLTCRVGNHSCVKDSLERFIVSLDFSADGLVERLDNNILVKPICYSFCSNPFKSRQRCFPVDFTYPFVCRNEVEIVYADSIRDFILPEDIAIATDGATFERKSRIFESSVVIASVLTVTKPQLPPSQYEDLRSFFEKVAQSGLDEVTAIAGTGE